MSMIDSNIILLVVLKITLESILVHLRNMIRYTQIRNYVRTYVILLFTYVRTYVRM